MLFFGFEKETVFRILDQLSCESVLEYVKELLALFRETDGKQLKIPEDYYRFEYVILLCLERGEGAVCCKQCSKTYSAAELKNLSTVFTCLMNCFVLV